ncbi:hypothetical protein VOLCADRAFT_99817 [Volvox carteri f. nagariensis]|uniref:Uncharacterized protein n=1 Tax=Volvox carteri f. nagariensis TaxID=3068 RepID=D8UIQ7_VOLCA|nr:uncharacterized protein VOLCADRAFT_99817 [Volvox carteri f. nagariensis]EFJ40381.1 hypothetical protein VOLCADRAFT_99817 [Volvox carteri f. nagariensis]|eukprot:XP_002958532.1 hypothetical protein VOLCADRAFT_99817 [Volvox carteri f. nagariensis]
MANDAFRDTKILTYKGVTKGLPGVEAPSTVSLDQGATRFFAALRTVAVPDAGNLLTVGSGDVSFLLHNPNYQLYVRKCYPDLFYALYESTSKKHVGYQCVQLGPNAHGDCIIIIVCTIVCS